jgi:hypothetical protein
MPSKVIPHLVDSFVAVEARGPRKIAPHSPRLPLPAITISREAGARGNTVAALLRDELTALRAEGDPPWVLFNQTLMDEVFRAHCLPSQWSRFFPEARPNEWRSAIESLLSNRPDPWTVFELTQKTIRRILAAGHAIVVGRGAHLIGQDLPHVIHLRFIGSPQARFTHLLLRRGGKPDVVRDWMERTDLDRRAFVRQYFDREVNDPADYTMVMRTDRMSDEAIVASVVALVEILAGTPAR